MRSYNISFFCLVYFTCHNDLKDHPCCCKWQDFLLFVYHIFILLLTVDGRLGCFHILAIVITQQWTWGAYIFLKFYLFSFWLLWVFLAVRGLSLVVASEGYSLVSVQGRSFQGLLLLWSTGSRVPGFGSCGVGSVCGRNAHGIFLHQGLNPCPLHGRQILNHWTTREVLYVFSS